MDSEKPYLDQGLSLGGLADMIGISANQLSQLLNEGFDQNFAEFINSFRLEIFKSKVADPKMRNFDILALAYESGFSSKNAFNTYFNKMMGQTPMSYWNAVTQ